MSSRYCSTSFGLDRPKRLAHADDERPNTSEHTSRCCGSVASSRSRHLRLHPRTQLDRCSCHRTMACLLNRAPAVGAGRSGCLGCGFACSPTHRAWPSFKTRGRSPAGEAASSKLDYRTFGNARLGPKNRRFFEPIPQARCRSSAGARLEACFSTWYILSVRIISGHLFVSSMPPVAKTKTDSLLGSPATGPVRGARSG